MLEKIKRAGLSDYQISSRLAIPQPTICRLRNGVHKTTSYEYGCKIKALADEVCKS